MQAEADVQASGNAAAKTILVAEDSSTIQDLLKLILSQRGLEVDIVEDGRQALEALRTKRYDIALLDFNMPEMTGLEVVATYVSGQRRGPRPHFVAITGDPQGLLESPDNCEHFDRVLPKPLEIASVVATVDELGAAQQVATHAARKPAGPAVRRRRSAIEDLGFEVLRWPDDADLRRLAIGAGEGGFRAVLVYDTGGLNDLMPLWHGRGLHLLPVIDLSGRLGPAADLDAAHHAGDAAAADMIRAFAERRLALHPDLLRADTPEDRLLARVYVSGKRLTPHLNGNHKGLVVYNTALDPESVRATARKLVERGLLAAEFFERLQVCGTCRSSRLIVREECPECTSAEIDEATYLHHFRCAYQGPESDFRDRDDLICPKCRQELRHFGRDYDRPGTMVICAACGHAAAEPEVGFVCVDCGGHTTGEAVATRDVHCYRLTEQGIGYLEGGAAFLGAAQSTLRFAELPLDLVVALNSEARKYNATGEPFTFLSVAYQHERDIVREHGASRFSAARKLFTEILQQALGSGSRIVSGPYYDYALVPGVDPARVGPRLEDAEARAATELRIDPGARVSVFGPEDIG